MWKCGGCIQCYTGKGDKGNRNMIQTAICCGKESSRPKESPRECLFLLIKISSRHTGRDQGEVSSLRCFWFHETKDLFLNKQSITAFQKKINKKNQSHYTSYFPKRVPRVTQEM